MIDLIDLKAFAYEGGERGSGDRGRDPRGAARAGGGVPREADGRGRRELRRADGALPGGRGDRPRGDRHRAQAGASPTARSSRSPAAWRRRTSAPTGCSTRWSRTCPRRRCAARSPRSAPTARRSRSSPTRTARWSPTCSRPLADPYTGRINLFRVYRGHAAAPTRTSSTSPSSRRSGSASSASRCGKELEPATELGAGDIGAVAKLKETQRRRRPLREAGRHLLPAARPAGAGDGVRLRGEVEGRRGEGRDGGAAAHRGGPDPRRAPRPADRRADHRRPDPGPRRGDRRPDEAPLRRRDRAAPAAGALPGVDPQAGQGPRPLQEADRRPRPVRRLPHRDLARPRPAPASSSSTRSRAA